MMTEKPCPHRVSLPVLVVMLASAAWGADAPPSAIAIPDEVARERVTTALQSLYKAEFASRKSEDRLALARKLVDQSQQPGDTTERYVMLQSAAELAAKAGDTAVCMSAVDTLASTFRLDAPAERLRWLAIVVPAVSSMDQAVAAAGTLTGLADDAVQRDDYPTASKAMALAEQIARRSRDPSLLAQTRAQSDLVKTYADAWNQMGDVEDPLGGISPAGHSKLGRFHALVKGDWATALPHLVAGEDAALRDAAKTELAANDPATTLATADAWFDLAGKERSSSKQQMQAHSAFLYRMSLNGLGGLDRARVDKRLAELDRLIGGIRGFARRPPGAVLYLSFERDSLGQEGGKPVALDSSGHGLRGRITGAKPVSGPFGTALEFGADPCAVDLGNAKELAIIGSLSISMWLKPAELGARRNPLYKSYGSEYTFTLEIDGQVNFFYGPTGSDANPYQGFSNRDALPVKQWSHLVLVRDLGPARSLVWYRNGRRTADTAAQYQEARASANPVVLGHGYTGVPYLGLIDEVGIWPRALSDAEVKQLYDGSVNGR